MPNESVPDMRACDVLLALTDSNAKSARSLPNGTLQFKTGFVKRITFNEIGCSSSDVIAVAFGSVIDAGLNCELSKYCVFIYLLLKVRI
jgi:hypothetical protein